jgi:cytochrome c oxidase subunit 2
MTSRDVLHSFFIPDFRVKNDVLPGRYTTLWFEAKEPGTHQIFCTEMCGTGHSTMRGSVVVLSEHDYALWLEGDKVQPEAGGMVFSGTEGGFVGEGDRLTPLADMGRKVAAEKGCLRCHTVDGVRHIGPSWWNVFGSEREFTDGTKVRVDEAYLTDSMMDPRARVAKGFQPVMPTFQGLLEPGEAAAIVEYIKSLKPRRE